MTFKEAITTTSGEFFLKSPRALAGWTAEWLMIGSAKGVYAAGILFQKADRPADAYRAFKTLKAGATELLNHIPDEERK